ncbi:MAG TPA: hypothetical protein VFV85_01735 [Conexibacter sp.]|nr:hypothetical protein [Conexibacter sp.]
MADDAPSVPQLVEELDRILAERTRRGLSVTALGGVAIYRRATRRELFEQLGRGPVNDLDLVGRASERRDYRALFEELGYEVDHDRLIAGEGKRFLYHRREPPAVEIDLFIDELDMCHRIDLRQRISADRDTIPLSDLLLQKTQIVDLTRKDVVDAVVLLADHPVGGAEADAVDGDYVARLLADDWGLWQTTTTSLQRIRAFADGGEAPPPVADAVRARVTELERRIEAEPKSRRWKLRARIGTRKQWYQVVNEGDGAF